MGIVILQCKTQPMELIRAKDVVKATGIRHFGGENTARIMMSMLKLDKINDIYAQHYYKPVEAFVDSVLRDTGIKFSFTPDDLNKIPKTGPFIIVANHPFGGIEGLLLLKEILKIRPDFKLIANFLFNQVDPIRDYIFSVNPFETKKEIYSGIAGLRKAHSHLRSGHPIGIFPAGEVSTWQNNDHRFISDRVWNKSIIRFIKFSEVPVIPVYFHGNNSLMFHLMGKIHPLLRTVNIPSELLNKQKEELLSKIGNPIAPNENKDHLNNQEYGRWLRARTYMLEAGIKPNKLKLPTLTDNDLPVANPVPKLLLKKELENLSSDYVLYNDQRFSMYCAPTPEIPFIFSEIGRLRELTFRKVGEGTGKSTDTDQYDPYFLQLFIWDKKEDAIVGGYRIGKGNEILKNWGLNGFYIHSLFKLSHHLKPMLAKSLELGRSFVVKEYQRKPLSLFLLWKGILYFLLKNSEFRYMMGPVSISNTYSGLSKTLMTEWILSYHKASELNGLIKPRLPFKPEIGRTETSVLVKQANTLNKMDQLLSEIEPDGMKMPVLLKKYLGIGAKIANFNVDPLFKNSLDGFMLLDSHAIPTNLIRTLSKEAAKTSEVLV